MGTVQKAVAYLKRYGAKKLVRKAIEKRNQSEDYDRIRLEETASEEEKAKQRNMIFPQMPVISIIIPAFNSDEKMFTETLMSVKNQTYDRWQLCISDGGDNPVEHIINKVFGNDSRVKYIRLNKNLGISGNSNEALRPATGEYVAFLDHDDLLEPDALYETVACINRDNADFVYTDEDKVTEDLSHYFRPYGKPDYNGVLFMSNNYICHFTTIQRSIVTKAGGFRPEYDGAQDYDLFLRCAGLCQKISHVPKVLYHWRVGKSSTSDNPFNKEYAFLAGKRAIEDSLSRAGRKDIKVLELDDPGYFTLTNTREYDFSWEVLETDSDKRQKTDAEADFCYIIKKGMTADKDIIKALINRAVVTEADILVPKLIKKKKYIYNGIADTGNGHIKSLSGKPYWYKGEFNLGNLDMEVDLLPTYGVLVKHEYEEAFIEALESVGNKDFVRTEDINKFVKNLTGIKAVYSPRVTVKL